MNAPFFIEILTRNGDVLQRHRVENTPIRIGRAYDNDVMIDDPYIAAHHATVVEEDGDLTLHAETSHNGIIHKRQRHASIKLDGNTAIRLGHTRLRIRTADHKVADELLDSTNHHWEGWPPAVAGIALLIVVALCSNLLSTTSEIETLGLLTASIGIISTMLVWSGLWALANRLFSGSARLGRHLFIGACGYAAGEIWALLSKTIAYAFSWEFLDHYSEFFEMSLIGVVVYFHLITVNPRHKKHMLAITLGLAVAVHAVLLVNNYRNTGMFADKLYMEVILPPGVRQTGDQPLTEFFDEAAKLREQVEKERAEAVKKEEEKSLREGTKIGGENLLDSDDNRQFFK
jgi:pSer/pThr/pTyr-binding forkhead associated (FHA) protein